MGMMLCNECGRPLPCQYLTCSDCSYYEKRLDGASITLVQHFSSLLRTSLASKLYETDEYIRKNPTLHEEDSPWKINQLKPFVDKFITHIKKSNINLLDVGGGAGLILKEISFYIEKHHKIKVNKYSLDLSPGMLEIQMKNNRDLKKALNEDIRKTSLQNEEIDLTLMIDVIEHIPFYIGALEEIKRISNFTIFRVPLQDNFVSNTWNFLWGGKHREKARNTMGHINFYNFFNLKTQIETYQGRILKVDFSNFSDHLLKSRHHNINLNASFKLLCLVASKLFNTWPQIFSQLIPGGQVIILVKSEI